MVKNIEIIVSRYNEDLSWTTEEPFNKFTYTVYNKGVNDSFVKTRVSKIINLPNVGRCDHTYLYHIAYNYNDLANINVFFPGSLNNEYKKNSAKKMLYEIIQNKNAVFVATHSDNIKTQFENFTLDNWVCTDPKNAQLNSESALLPAVFRPFGKWFQFHFGNIKVQIWCIHGIFSIHRLDIVKHKQKRYLKLLSAVERHSNPEVGHYIERSWGAIFHPLLFTKIIR
jgi:hypothetical protein